MAREHLNRAGRMKGALNRTTRADMEALKALPPTDDPLQFLLNIAACEAISKRRRVEAAKAVLPYMRPRKADGTR